MTPRSPKRRVQNFAFCMTKKSERDLKVTKPSFKKYILSAVIVTFVSYFLGVYINNYFKSPVPKSRRIVAIGDLHGDLESSLNVFKLANIIDESQNWIGGDTIFVQTGDVVDRGPDAKNLYLLLIKLSQQALEAGGQIIQLLGNHEIMNLINNWDYVTEDDIQQFGGSQARLEAWNRDSGWLGRYLMTLNVTAIVNSTIFVHGGIHHEWASYFGIEKLNAITTSLLSEKSDSELSQERFLFGPDSPTWYRGYAQLPESEVCPLLESTLKTLKVERMVVGHTPQRSGKILSRCSGKFIDIDVGISKVYGRHHAALEIYPDRINALYPSGPIRIN